MCEDMTGSTHPYHIGRAERLKELCRLMGLDAILLITGWDGSYNLGSKSMVEWLCERPGAQSADYEDALEEGLFVITPRDVEWFVAHDADSTQVVAEHEQTGIEGASAQSPAKCRSCSSAPVPMQLSPAHSFEQESAIYQGIQQMHQQQHQHQHACCGHSAAGEGNTHTTARHSLPAAPVHVSVVHHTSTMQPTGQIDGKLSLLLQLHPHLKRIGVPLGTEVLYGQLHGVLGSTILKWPLLMALAETIGVQMEELFQDIVDISNQLPQFLSVVDGTMLFNLLRSRRSQLHRAWLEAMSVCWRRSSVPKLDLSEAAMAAPLIEFISGCSCRLSLGLYQPLALPPRVLFGPRTSETGALSNNSNTLRSISSHEGYAVLHAIAEASDACCGLRFARTVFFSQGAADRIQLVSQKAGQTAVPKGHDTQQTCQTTQPSVDYDVDHQDLFDLLCWYEAAVKAAWDGMKHFATQANASWASMQKCIAATCSAVVASAGLPQPMLVSESEGQSHQQQQQQRPMLTIQLFSWDGGPRPSPVLHGLEQYNMRLKTLRVMCSGIRSRSAAHPGALLGNVLYSDTFVEVPAMGGLPAQLVNLTITHCPLYTFNFWGAEAAENSQLVGAFRRHLQLQLQAQLTAQAQAQLQAHIQAQIEAQARRQSIDNPVGVSQQKQPAVQGAGDEMTDSPPSPASKTGPTQAMHMPPQSPQPPQQQQQQFLLLQQHLQQQQQALAAKRGLRRLSTPEQQQLLLLQQQQQAMQGQVTIQQHIVPLQASSNGQQQLQGQSGKHPFIAADNISTFYAPSTEGANNTEASNKPMKRSCCGSGSSGVTVAADGGDCGATGQGSGNATHSPAQTVSMSPRPVVYPGSPLVQRSPTPPLPAAQHAGLGQSSALYKSQSPDAAVTAIQSCAVSYPALLLQRLGQLLVPPGEMPGEIGLLFTGADKLAVMDGPLYPHQGGLAFISRPSKVHVLLLQRVESVWLQELGAQLPGFAAVGPCLVIKGKQPACGLLPAAHLTDNPHVLIPLRAMSKVCREHWVTAVLPAWQSAAGVVRNSQGAAAPWPVPVELQPAYRYWLQGARKRYMVLQPDEVMEALLLAMDKPRQPQDTDMHDASAIAAQL